MLIVAGLYLWRLDIAEHYARQALEARGLTPAELTVSGLGRDGIIIENLSAGTDQAGKPLLTLTRARADWTIADLRARRIERVTLNGLSLRVTQTEDDVTIAGLPLAELRSGADGGDSTSFTLDQVTLSDINILLQSDFGEASLHLQAEYDRRVGGQATLSATSGVFRYGDTALKETALETSITMRPDRSFNGAAAAALSVENGGRVYPDLQATLSFSGTDFLSLAQDRDNTEARATFNLTAPAMPLDVFSPYKDYVIFAAGEMPVTSAVSARGLITLAGGIISLENINENYVSAQTDTGLDIVMSAPAGTIIGRWSDTRSWVNLDYGINGLKASPAGGHIDIAREGDGPIRVRTDFTTAEWKADTFTLIPGSASFSGEIDGPLVSGDVRISGGPSRLETNNMVLRNLPLSGDFSVEANLETRTAEVTVPRGCIELARPAATLRNGAFRFTNAAFCPPAAGPIVLTAALDETGALVARADGIITASTLNTKIGETTITGRPPRAVVSLDIKDRTATARAGLYGGSIDLNQLINLSAMNGRGRAVYQDGSISMSGDVNTVTLKDLRIPTAFSPLSFSGNFTVRDAQASFSGDLAIPGADSFSTLQGDYDLTARDGEARLNFGPLTLNPEGFQLTDVLPVLKGYVENAGGNISGNVQLRLAREGLQTGASVTLDGLTFNGPTRAVTRTGNLSLDAEFDGLLPLRTRGVQTAKIGLVDLDALKLENGDIRFSAPGDGTMQVLSAVWPWFGGTLSITEAVVPLDGSTISVPLTVSNIDIAQLLEFFGVNGLSGAGRLDGTLPVVIEGGSAKISNGTLRAITPGKIAYESVALQRAAENAGAGGKLAFEALRSFDFDQLVLTINGDLAGDVSLGLRLEGITDLEGITSQSIDDTGIHFNININAPLSGLIRQLNQQRQSKEAIFDDLVGEKGLELEFGDAERVKP